MELQAKGSTKEAVIQVDGKPCHALLRIFSIDEGDLRFVFGRAEIAGIFVNQLVGQNKLQVFRIDVDQEEWHAVIFNGTQEWANAQDISTVHADFYVVGWPGLRAAQNA